MNLFKNIIPYIFFSLTLFGCAPKPNDAVKSGQKPVIYPDYTDVTVPKNIAPLNFMLRDTCAAVYVTLSSPHNSITASRRGSKISLDTKDWKRLLADAAPGEIKVQVWSMSPSEKWTEYEPFTIFVSDDEIDPYLTYRLIEPDYEVFSRLQIKERNLEDFSERTLCDYNMVGNRCMNCHTFGSGRPDLSFMYVRGDGGGMIMNRDGVLTKLNLKTPDMVGGSVYAHFSPSGRYLVFSTNVIIPAFHSRPEKRLEVFDTKSDVYVVDLDENRILRSPLLSDSLNLETFPTFSPDGKSIYYCTAKGPGLPQNIDTLQYSLCRIPFYETTGAFGMEVDTIVRASKGDKNSVCHPRVSPDGKYLLYTVADYGTFPIWHQESDQRLLNLSTGEVNSLDVVNSDRSDTYHSWSQNGRWFVFASKRDDGLYGKPYFCHIDENGNPSKPFLLPQKSPDFYDECLKSFNVPELGKGKVDFTVTDVKNALSLPPTIPQ